MRKPFPLLVGSLACVLCCRASDLQISLPSHPGEIAVQGAYPGGVVTVERASRVEGAWTPVRSVFSTDGTARAVLEASGPGGFFRARAVDLEGVSGPWTLESADILDLATMAAVLSAPADTDGVSLYLVSSLSSSTVALLSGYPGSASDAVVLGALVGDLNSVIRGPAFYDADRFFGVPLSPSTLRLAEGAPTGEAVQRLNRQLLEDAYPAALRQKRAAAFSNFTHSFGLLSTVAGNGVITCVSCNSWVPEAEGGAATSAPLSSPHISMADRAGNIYIADKRAHAIRKVTPDGILTTVAGIDPGGGVMGDTNPAPAISLPLNNPNGIWVRGDGVFYILDRDNGLIRKVDTDGIMSVMVDYGTAIPGGRGLWVSPDESLLYFSANSQVMRWDSTNGLSSYATGFAALGNMCMDPGGRLVVADATRNQVVRLEPDGTQTVIAGTPTGTGGGDGWLATETGLSQVRGVWFLPNGGFFLCTDNASQLWYVDTDAHIHLLGDGDNSGAHAGDGEWFYSHLSTHKFSNIRAMTTDYEGNLLITESNLGYVRKIQFLPGGL